MASTGSSFRTVAEGLTAARSDIVVGIASYNDAETIGGVLRGARDALDQHLAAKVGSIVLADGGSLDQTLERARAELGGDSGFEVIQFDRPQIDPLRTPYHGRAGRAAAIHAVFRAARARDAKVCVMLDAGLMHLPPDWIDLLVEPVLHGEVDYVSAHYERHPHEGAITKSIIYPVFRVLYGVRLRQPAAPEFGCSAGLMDAYLQQGFWDAEEAYTGIDLWLATSAAAAGHRIGEALLGMRTFAPRPVAPDLNTALGQLVGSLMSDLEMRAQLWQRLRTPVSVPTFGAPQAIAAESPPIDVAPMLESFRLGYHALRDVWAWILPPRTIIELKRLADASSGQFRLADDLWARIIYDFALAHRLNTMPHVHLLGTLTPLYFGWLASFVLEPGTATVEGAQDRIERLCTVFEAQKPYLISRWRWPERFRS
jgi:glucosylglycerate synthase